MGIDIIGAGIGGLTAAVAFQQKALAWAPVGQLEREIDCGVGFGDEAMSEEALACGDGELIFDGCLKGLVVYQDLLV